MRFRSKNPVREHHAVRFGGLDVPSDNVAVRRQIASSFVFAACVVACLSVQAFAGEADVVDVKATQLSDNTWRFDVSVLHADAGWDHYADKWAVFAPDGSMLGERILAHPHDNEQPFTRSQSGIVIPDDLTEVVIKAHDNVHGWGGKEVILKLDR